MEPERRSVCSRRVPALSTLLGVGLTLGAAACSRQAPFDTFEIVVRVEADAGQPMTGARLLSAGKLLGLTDQNGRVVMRATGHEGGRVELEVGCPEDHKPAEGPLAVTLRHSAEPPEYVAYCPPLSRKLVVVARLEQGAGLPIRYLGRELARSDAAGVAHFVVEAPSEKDIELTVDTSERPLLRPKSPVARFRVADRDDVVVLAQAFQSAQKPALRPQRAGGPVRIR